LPFLLLAVANIQLFLVLTTIKIQKKLNNF